MFTKNLILAQFGLLGVEINLGKTRLFKRFIFWNTKQNRFCRSANDGVSGLR